MRFSRPRRRRFQPIRASPSAVSCSRVLTIISYYCAGRDMATSTRQQADAPDASGWSASLYNKTVPFVYSPVFTAPVLELLAAQPGERIIDFGCGSGEVTLELKKIVERVKGGVVVGVDFSESMVCYIQRFGFEFWSKSPLDCPSQSQRTGACIRV